MNGIRTGTFRSEDEENDESSAASSSSSSSNYTKTHHQTVDGFLSNLGDPGRFQIVVMILLASNCIPVVVNHLLMAFYAVSTPHNCRVSLVVVFCGNAQLV